MYTINLYLIKANDQYHVKRSGTKISVLQPIETLIVGKSIKHLLCAQGTLKLKDINFRFLHRRLATNSYLQKKGIRQDRKRNFCHNEKEDLFHIFWQCQKTKMLWQNLATWLQSCQILPKDNQLLMETALSLRLDSSNFRL